MHRLQTEKSAFLNNSTISFENSFSTSPCAKESICSRGNKSPAINMPAVSIMALLKYAFFKTFSSVTTVRTRDQVFHISLFSVYEASVIRKELFLYIYHLMIRIEPFSGLAAKLLLPNHFFEKRLRKISIIPGFFEQDIQD